MKGIDVKRAVANRLRTFAQRLDKQPIMKPSADGGYLIVLPDSDFPLARVTTDNISYER